MKTIANLKRKSLVKSSVIYYSFGIVILMIFYTAINIFVSFNLENSFLIIDDLLVYDEYINNDDYFSIPLKKFKNSDFIIFDESYNILFSTNRELRKLGQEQIEMLNDYTNEVYFNISKKAVKDEYVYLITKNKVLENEEMDEVIKYAVLDSELNVTAGDLFSKKKKLSNDDLNLLIGKYADDKGIEKHVYTNSHGETRILVFISQELDLFSYNKILNENNYLWLCMIPASFLVIFIVTVLFIRKINKDLTVLNKKLIIYEVTNQLDISENEVPYEFKSVVKNLKILVDHLENVSKENVRIYKERNRVISNISHDLKTPLTVIQGYASSFLDGLVPKNKEKQYLKAIVSKSTAASAIIDSLFEYTKLEHPDYKMTLTRVNIADFIQDYLFKKANEIEVEGFKLIYDIPKTKVFYFVDENLMIRLFNNIINNSLKYNPKGTEIYFYVKISQNRFKLILGDNGMGIKKEVINSVFDPFVMGDSARSTSSSTGLGLSIAKKIVYLHDGIIKIVARPKMPFKTRIEIIIPNNIKKN